MFTEKSDDVVMEGGGALALDVAPVGRPKSRPQSFVPPPATPTVAPARYGETRRINPVAVLLVAAIHIALLAALLYARTEYVKKKEADLTLVNLAPPPAPPPATQETPPEPTKTPVVAPVAVVQVPVPSPVFASPEPSPAPPSPVAAPPAPAAVIAAPPSIVTGGDLSAQMVSGKPPRYPLESRRKREQGTVVLSLIVGTDGRVESLSIQRSSGFDRLDNAARDAVRGWRWNPLTRNGQPMRVRGIVEIPFVIQG